MKGPRVAGRRANGNAGDVKSEKPWPQRRKGDFEAKRISREAAI
jgi:hypothetical protein